ncbi:hypothetical protein AXE65_08865 [Ventosimonas gracilis]|uniref:DNA 3'-5' helicase II n=1 Tax=Ventosimonas gracilis TaxID=1680762 RepID=A0A139SYA1_9GAMM|nr:nuclease-related domain-containing DEAD/DEAH box helicase [Ventosimonas gracilis]KXU39372.1 hypothetical protein AXE65_08865 [Ventosimonas gracilis]
MTRGEKKLAALLSTTLTEDGLVWYEVVQGNKYNKRYPDFIILQPKQGLLFVEVKDWKLDIIKSLDMASCEILTKSGIKRQIHPLEQARQVANRSAQWLQENPKLLHKEGAWQGRLLFPYGYGVWFSNITRAQMASIIPQEVFERLLPSHQVLFKDDLPTEMTAATLQQRLQAMFDIRFPCQLEREQIDAIRWHLFPEVRIGADGGQTAITFTDSLDISSKPVVDQSLQVAEQAADYPIKPTLPEVMRVMDYEQEQLARGLGEGHRVIHGVAGSGKTLILGARCLHLAQALTKPILVLCYNITLAAKLRSFIADKGLTEDKVQVQHFHGWCSEQCKAFNIKVPYRKENYFDAFVEAVIKALEEGQIPRGQYGAVLIDEGHDFEPEWLRLTTQLVDPAVNSLLLLYDDAQSIYKKRSALEFSLASVGIQAQGRTTILKINYRNTQEIMQFAWNLTKANLKKNNDKSDIPQIAPQSAGGSGLQPVVRQFANMEEEITWLVRCLGTIILKSVDYKISINIKINGLLVVI